MTNIIELKTCRYKGVEFLFDDTSTTGGNRLIKFNYPGSDKQAIERQGKAPRSFSITAIIPHEDYFIKRDDLIRVLEDGAEGVLTHPFWGDIENVITGTYSLNERISELGRGTISIQFEINDAVGIPIEAGDLQTLTEFEFNALNEITFTDIANEYLVSLGFVGNFTDAVENITAIATEFRKIAELEDQIVNEAAGFFTIVQLFERNIFDNIVAPLNLAIDIDEMFSSLNNLYETPSARLTVFKGLFGFGDNDREIKTTTAGRIERKKNRDIINSTIKTTSLSYAYVNAVQIEYDTTEDLDLIQNELEDQYIKIRDDQLVSNATQEQLDRTRVQAIKTLNNARVTSRQIINVTTPRLPLSVLLYQWYGNTELFDTIAELNNIKENAFVEGDIKLLTE